MAVTIFRCTHDEFAASLKGISDFADIGPLLQTHVGSLFDDVFAEPCMDSVDRAALFAAICRWALEELQRNDCVIVPTSPGKQGFSVDVRQFPASRCRGILANALLGNTLDTMADRREHQGGLRFSYIGPQKMAALLLYFNAGLALEGTGDDDRSVCYLHVRCPAMEDFKLQIEKCTESLCSYADANMPLVRFPHIS